MGWRRPARRSSPRPSRRRCGVILSGAAKTARAGASCCLGVRCGRTLLALRNLAAHMQSKPPASGGYISIPIPKSGTGALSQVLRDAATMLPGAWGAVVRRGAAHMQTEVALSKLAAACSSQWGAYHEEHNLAQTCHVVPFL